MPAQAKIRVSGQDDFNMRQSLTAQIDGLFDFPYGSEGPARLYGYPEGEAWIDVLSIDWARLSLPKGQVDIRLDQPVPQLENGAPDWQSFGMLLAEDTQFHIRGGRGNDFLLGGKWGDRISGRDGDDTILSGGGDDKAIGGRGDDLLFGGTGQNVLRGGADNDLLMSGEGRDKMQGGRGNDLIVDIDGGSARATGGKGQDVFIVGVATTAGGNPDGFQDSGTSGRMVITDFGSDDLLVLSGVQTTASGSPDGLWSDRLPKATLADWGGAGADSFEFRDTRRGVEMVWGEEEILLRGVLAEDVLLDQLFFTPDPSLSGFDAWGTDTATAVAYSPGGTVLSAYDAEDHGVLTNNENIMFETILFDSFTTFGHETSL